MEISPFLFPLFLLLLFPLVTCAAPRDFDLGIGKRLASLAQSKKREE